MRYREKELWWELGSAATALVAFVLLSWLRPVRDGWSYLMLMWMWIGPSLYFTAKMYSSEEKRTDERDREIDAKGDLAALRVLNFGAIFLLFSLPLAGVNGTVTVNKVVGVLFVLLATAQIVRMGKKLRIYAGHESFLPDRWVARRRAKTLRRIADRTVDKEVRARWLAMADEIEAKARR